ncbi:hypothetical protein Taro_046993 [Colocasia esculenta]|uniref:Secreted protein n=1 Tax=Colocasia esculenta TaxID=4460 RepID=A0A843X064_COLES|nr:hypothetical protein [Colocasia esculenta]
MYKMGFLRVSRHRLLIFFLPTTHVQVRPEMGHAAKGSYRAAGVLGDHDGPPTGAGRSSHGHSGPPWDPDGVGPSAVPSVMFFSLPICLPHPAYPSTGRSTSLGLAFSLIPYRLYVFS